ncbi:hypothetical protein E2C01_057293 [Portunus trituberculatus]|uniref:Uncharacterized protein n=1 Tax=Portunus trituberculatus TaxID=210409 RepID=A0A5B7GZX8_PORTR|nr:hypothetical protein [Portunus trituberculatus]
MEGKELTNIGAPLKKVKQEISKTELSFLSEMPQYFAPEAQETIRSREQKQAHCRVYQRKRSELRWWFLAYMYKAPLQAEHVVMNER